MNILTYAARQQFYLAIKLVMKPAQQFEFDMPGLELALVFNRILFFWNLSVQEKIL